MASVNDLAAVPLFSSLEEEHLTRLANWFHVQSASRIAEAMQARAGQIAQLA